MRKFLVVAVLAAVIAPAAAQPPTAWAPKNKFAAVPPKEFLLDVPPDVRARSGRVPRGYGPLGLTKEQKERVYGIQAAYAERIAELEAEIEQLKEEQLVRIKTVLTEAQRLQIEKYELEAAAKKQGKVVAEE